MYAKLSASRAINMATGGVLRAVSLTVNNAHDRCLVCMCGFCLYYVYCVYCLCG